MVEGGGGAEGEAEGEGGGGGGGDGTRAAAAEARGEKGKIHHCREEKIVVPHEPFSGCPPRAGLEQDDGQPLPYPS